jgi:hypothetical protein
VYAPQASQDARGRRRVGRSGGDAGGSAGRNCFGLLMRPLDQAVTIGGIRQGGVPFSEGSLGARVQNLPDRGGSNLLV